MRRFASVVVLATLLAAAIGLPAAGVLGETADAGAARVKVDRDGDTLLVTGTAAPIRDRIEIRTNEARSRYILEASRPIDAPSCRPRGAASQRVRCPSAGVLTIGVFLGTGSDIFKVGSRRVTASVVAFGGRGDDRLVGGGAVEDFLGGGAGRDILKGRGGSDKLRGAQGRDDLRGGRGNDRLNGGPGGDVCAGGPGRDVENRC